MSVSLAMAFASDKHFALMAMRFVACKNKCEFLH